MGIQEPPFLLKPSLAPPYLLCSLLINLRIVNTSLDIANYNEGFALKKNLYAVMRAEKHTETAIIEFEIMMMIPGHG